MSARRVCVRGVIYRDGELFAQRLKKTDKENDFWCTPGGGLDLGESLHEGLRREMIEETGVEPRIGKLLFIQQFGDEHEEQLEFFFLIENTEDYEVIDLANTTHGEIEIEEFGFIDSATTNILPAYLQTLDIKSYIDSIVPLQILTELKSQSSYTSTHANTGSK